MLREDEPDGEVHCMAVVLSCDSDRDGLQGITGSKMEKACDVAHITVNKNAVVGDVSAMAPGGVRVGAPAMTSRGLKEQDFEQIADLLHEVLGICKRLQEKHGKLLKDFNK